MVPDVVEAKVDIRLADKLSCQLYPGLSVLWDTWVAAAMSTDVERGVVQRLKLPWHCKGKERICILMQLLCKYIINSMQIICKYIISSKCVTNSGEVQSSQICKQS